MQVVLLRVLVPFPDGLQTKSADILKALLGVTHPAKNGTPIVRLLSNELAIFTLDILRLLPDVPIALRVIDTRPGFFEPIVLIRGMIDHEVHDELDA